MTSTLSGSGMKHEKSSGLGLNQVLEMVSNFAMRDALGLWREGAAFLKKICYQSKKSMVYGAGQDVEPLSRCEIQIETHNDFGSCRLSADCFKIRRLFERVINGGIAASVWVGVSCVCAYNRKSTRQMPLALGPKKYAIRQTFFKRVKVFTKFMLYFGAVFITVAGIDMGT